MAALERLLGSAPRTKVAEALIRLGSLTVSRADIAREAGLWRASTNRVLEDFEAEGMISRVANGKRPLFRANLDSPYLLLFARFAAALELVDLGAGQGGNKCPAPGP
jgi:DNA-binding IclR family transcriptional regulator